MISLIRISRYDSICISYIMSLSTLQQQQQIVSWAKYYKEFWSYYGYDLFGVLVSNAWI